MAGLTGRYCMMRECNTHIPMPHIFCERHWKLIPVHLREEISVAWSDGDIEELEELLMKARNAITAAERRRQGGA